MVQNKHYEIHRRKAIHCKANGSASWLLNVKRYVMVGLSSDVIRSSCDVIGLGTYALLKN